ncbi:MAG: PfkB family carbohydrate kinase, partial [Ruthenibacterium sp.]
MTQARLQELLAGFGRLHITVVGDLFLDRWWEVDRSLDEPSVETGLTAYQVTGRRQSAGAAGTVLNNLAALGVGDVQAVSMVGDDGEGFELLRLLEKAGIGTSGVVRRGDIFTPAYT